ncbi:ABC transporter permease [Gulosibacter sp. 10]|uniref:ABC transporter permease n=1 Tax=Gulosibacter sp. 10 TaxID=1255570 RepID=UPI000B361813|nr:ABC transporter permease [Gulosibacter sp. 10]
MTQQTTSAAPAPKAPPKEAGRRGWGELLRSERVPVPGILILLAIAVIMTAINPRFLSGENLVSIAQQSVAPVVIAVGLTFVVLMGGIDLSVAGIMAASSMCVASLIANNQNGNDFGLLGVGIAVALGAGLGAVAGFSVGWLKIPSFIVTIGTWQIGLGIGQLLFAAAPPQIEDAALRTAVSAPILGLPGIVWIGLVVVALGALLQTMTRFGRYAFVIGDSEEIALQSGIRVRRYRLAGFIIAAACSALAAVLVTTRGGVGDVNIGGDLLFTTIAGVVIGGTYLTGGRGGVFHSVVGVLIVVAISNAMVLGGVDPYIQQAVQGGVVIVAAVVTMWHLRERLRVVK